MKHVKLFEDFAFSKNPDLKISMYDKMNADKLAAKAKEFGFPILSNPNVAANYLKYGNIWAIENGSDLYFYQPSVDAERPITTPSNKRISLADFCTEVGCTENEILSRTEGGSGATKYLIGYFATGGHGSHPGIATVNELEKLGWTDQGNGKWKHMGEDFDFYGHEVNQIPQALLCVFDMDTLWYIKPITRQQADVIYNVGGSADYSEENENDFEKVLNDVLPGIIDKRFNNPATISVIRNVEPNTIYWSDVPEELHGYWEAEDSRPISIDDFTNSGDY
jgi:hypothetical protein